MRDASLEQAEAAAHAARAAFAGWSARIPADRSAYLLTIADVVELNSNELAKLEHLDTGKPHGQILNEEIRWLQTCFAFTQGQYGLHNRRPRENI